MFAGSSDYNYVNWTNDRNTQQHVGGAYWKYVFTLGYDTQVWWEWHACFYITIGRPP